MDVHVLAKLLKPKIYATYIGKIKPAVKKTKEERKSRFLTSIEFSGQNAIGVNRRQ